MFALLHISLDKINYDRNKFEHSFLEYKSRRPFSFPNRNINFKRIKVIMSRNRMLLTYKTCKIDYTIQNVVFRKKPIQLSNSFFINTCL